MTPLTWDDVAAQVATGPSTAEAQTTAAPVYRQVQVDVAAGQAQSEPPSRHAAERSSASMQQQRAGRVGQFLAHHASGKDAVGLAEDRCTAPPVPSLVSDPVLPVALPTAGTAIGSGPTAADHAAPHAHDDDVAVARANPPVPAQAGTLADWQPRALADSDDSMLEIDSGSET